MIEIWKDIPGFEGLYEISSLGVVKSKLRYYKRTSKGTPSYQPMGPKVIKTYIARGYHYVNLYKNSKPNKYSVHRLLGLIFIPNPQKKEQINHINGIKTDNRLENLEWVTRSENGIHAFRVLKRFARYNSGKDHHASKPVLQFSLDGLFIKEWDSRNAVKKNLGLFVYSCCVGKTKTSGEFIWKYK